MKFFIWNDNDEELLKWARCATRISNWTEEKKSDPTDQHMCLVSRSIDSAQVAAECEAYRPDVVILDIVATEPKVGTDKRLGIAIAKRIRRLDELVPIIAVTAHPNRLYEFGGDMDDPDVEERGRMSFDEIRFAGIYHNSVMESDSTLHDLAISPSLIHWHILTPEYVLVRKCIELLKLHARGDQRLLRMAAFLDVLPHQSMASWHRSLAEKLAALMGELGLDGIAKGFTELCQQFEAADPLYMAFTKSRVHLSHNVQVFLLGLVGLLGIDHLRNCAVENIRALAIDNSWQEADERDPLLCAVLVWACVGMTHDAAYLAETGQKFFDELKVVMSRFIPKRPQGQGHDISPLDKVTWPQVKHSEVCRQLWQLSEAKGMEQHLVALVGSAVYYHDPIKERCNEECQVVDSERWLDFLAILSDELQDWGRVRPELPPGADDWASNPWRLFALQSIVLRNGEGVSGTALDLGFLAVDNPRRVHDALAKPGTSQVERRFEWTRAQLKKRLRSKTPLDVVLNVSFSSRSTTCPSVTKIANILPPAN